MSVSFWLVSVLFFLGHPVYGSICTTAVFFHRCQLVICLDMKHLLVPMQCNPCVLDVVEFVVSHMWELVIVPQLSLIDVDPNACSAASQ